MTKQNAHVLLAQTHWSSIPPPPSWLWASWTADLLDISLLSGVHGLAGLLCLTRVLHLTGWLAVLGGLSGVHHLTGFHGLFGVLGLT